jgi:polar amino acid transport system substrate-binding protein
MAFAAHSGYRASSCIQEPAAGNDTMILTPSIRGALTPMGKLRASINLGNPILANRNSADARPGGISIDLATELASRIGAELELLLFDSAGKSVEAVTARQADVGFFAIDPIRGQGLLFTAPYVLIEGSYLVAEDSPLSSNDEVDREGTCVVVGNGSAYDLYLTRELKKARILRAPTSPAVVDTFVAEKADVAAGVRQQLEADAARKKGLRLLPGRFMVIQQALGVPAASGKDVQEFVAAFVEDMKSSGFVLESMQRHGIKGAAVAPAAGDRA